jgi:hypothetical protein
MEDNKVTMLVLPSKSSPSKCRDSPILRNGMSLDSADPSGPVILATTIANQDLSPSNTSGDAALFKKLKKEHNLAKAVKNNNAEVRVHLWDDAIWAGAPSRLIKCREGAHDPPKFFNRAMAGFQKLFIRLYCQRLWKDIYTRLVRKYGQGWVEVGRKGGNRGASVKVEAAHEILWCTSENGWFEYPMGSQSLYFCFPHRYQSQALSGVKVCYITPGPKSKRQQPPLEADKETVIKKKIQKFVAKGFIAPVTGQVGLLIKYLPDPKGIINGVMQDWKTVFHAGTNKLNNCIWMPLFSLPTLNSLLHIVDEDTLMADRDMGEMFLNVPEL